MIGLGTLINAGCIVAGGLIGFLAGKFLTERFQKIINIAIALSIIAMSLSGILAEMLVISGEKIATRGTYVLIFALVPGAVLGELINIDRQLERLGVWLRRKTGNAGDPVFVDGFVDASLTVCIGAMAVVGSVLILCIGVNLIADGKFRIRVANLLPSILFAVAAAYLPFLS